MTWRIKFHKAVRADMRRLPTDVLSRIRRQLEHLRENPWKYTQPIRGAPLRKLRVGDYRIIVRIAPKERTVYVILVGHRRNVYRRVWRRQQ